VGANELGTLGSKEGYPEERKTKAEIEKFDAGGSPTSVGRYAPKNKKTAVARHLNRLRTESVWKGKGEPTAYPTNWKKVQEEDLRGGHRTARGSLPFNRPRVCGGPV